jgi:hypothetical protein
MARAVRVLGLMMVLGIGASEFAAWSQAAESGAGARRNVVFILSDDHR